MKKLIIIYSEDDWEDDDVLTESPNTKKAIEELHAKAKESDIELHRASICWYDSDSNVFKKSWTFNDGRWVKIDRFITPDFVLDKLSGKQDYEMFQCKIAMSKKAVVLNSPLFRTMLGNKLSQYLCLGSFMPESFLAVNESEIGLAFEKIKSSKVVVKPIHGSGGFGIYIGEKESINLKNINFPVMVQEFVEAVGIPGSAEKNELSDLRIVFIDHEPIYALSRIAKEGSLFTNFHQGASVCLVPLENIPVPVLDIVEKIKEKLSIYARANYSLDFMFDKKGKPYLIEMNTSPGLDLLHIVGTKEIKDRYYSEIIRSLNN